MGELYCVHHGPLERHGCMALIGGPLLCAYCGPSLSVEVTEVSPVAPAPLRRMLERHLQALGWEADQADHEGVQTWLAPSAGYEDGIRGLTTQEAIAHALAEATLDD